MDRLTDAQDVLAEAGDHYAALAADDRGRYAVALCDVRLRQSLTLVMAGRYEEAVPVGRAALRERTRR